METDEHTDEQFSRRLGAVVSIRIKAAGTTVSDVVRGTGIARPTLDRSLAGHRPFAATELHSIARLLDVRASVLIDEAEAA